MALVPETGEGLPNAQTYATVEHLKAYAKVLGEPLPPSNTDCEALLAKAWRAMLNLDYIGHPTTRDQAGAFPRIGTTRNGYPVGGHEISRDVLDAQCALALVAKTTDLLPTIVANASGGMIERTIGPITTRWADSGRASTRPIVESAKAHLQKLLRSGGNNIRLARG